jgi:hypothetical protein
MSLHTCPLIPYNQGLMHVKGHLRYDLRLGLSLHTCPLIPYNQGLMHVKDHDL